MRWKVSSKGFPKFSIYFSFGHFKNSIFVNAPNYLVGYIIQNRKISFLESKIPNLVIKKFFEGGGSGNFYVVVRGFSKILLSSTRGEEGVKNSQNLFYVEKG